MKLRLAFLVSILLAALTVAPFYRTPRNGPASTPVAALGQIGSAEDLPTIQADLTHRHRAVQRAATAADRRLQARLATGAELNKEQQL